jgi:hypothetical protein
LTRNACSFFDSQIKPLYKYNKKGKKGEISPISVDVTLIGEKLFFLILKPGIHLPLYQKKGSAIFIFASRHSRLETLFWFDLLKFKKYTR